MTDYHDMRDHGNFSIMFCESEPRCSHNMCFAVFAYPTALSCIGHSRSPNSSWKKWTILLMRANFTSESHACCLAVLALVCQNFAADVLLMTNEISARMSVTKQAMDRRLTLLPLAPLGDACIMQDCADVWFDWAPPMIPLAKHSF